jgi:hypothetical protein
MQTHDVPQEGNATLSGHKKAVYAKDTDGHIISTASAGWEVEEIVTLQAVTNFHALQKAARIDVESGKASTLLYWMHAQRMDVPLLAQTTGIWRWRIRKHFLPMHFSRLSTQNLHRYAEALGISVEQLTRLP